MKHAAFVLTLRPDSFHVIAGSLLREHERRVAAFKPRQLSKPTRGRSSLIRRLITRGNAPVSMDAAQSVAQQLTEAESWGGQTRPHKVAEVLSLLLPLLPLDARARAACVCRAWRAAASAPALWEELSFEQCAARVSDAVLAAMCARAGAALRALRLDADACTRVTCYGMLAALRGGGCTGVRRLWAPRNQNRWHKDCLTAQMVQQLVAACPVLVLAACSARCETPDASAVCSALPGPLTLECGSFGGAGVPQLMECLRGNTTLTSLEIHTRGPGFASATQLAESLRVNATLTHLDLWSNNIGDAGVTQLAECLRVNTTLRSLVLGDNRIGDASVSQLAECLRGSRFTTNEPGLCSSLFAYDRMTVPYLFIDKM